MNEHRDRPDQADEEVLLRRWYAASSQSRPIPSAELLTGGERVRRGRLRFRNLAVAAVTIAVIIGGIAGAGAWASLRSVSASSSSPSTPAPAGTPSLVPTASTGPQSSPATSEVLPGPNLAQHEAVVQMHATLYGGWLLTGSRLLIINGRPGWHDCWRSPAGDLTSPYLHAVVAGDVVLVVRVISKTTMWTSIDGCASWVASVLPIAPTGVAFPTQTTGYIAVGDESGSNQQAHIYRTDDAGQHWKVTAGKVTAIASPNGHVFYGNLAVEFADASHGWLTDSHTLWTTANGGDTWTLTTLPGPRSAQGQLDLITTPAAGADGSAVVVAKYDATPGMDGARGQQVFYRTVDRGAHWTPVAVITDPGMLRISLVDPTTWAVLDPSTPASLKITTDAGSTWQTIAIRELWPYNSGPIDFADSLHGWMVVSESYPPCPGAPVAICDYAYAPPQHLVTTDDGGATWVELKP